MGMKFDYFAVAGPLNVEPSEAGAPDVKEVIEASGRTEISGQSGISTGTAFTPGMK